MAESEKEKKTLGNLARDRLHARAQLPAPPSKEQGARPVRGRRVDAAWTARLGIRGCAAATASHVPSCCRRAPLLMPVHDTETSRSRYWAVVLFAGSCKLRRPRPQAARADQLPLPSSWRASLHYVHSCHSYVLRAKSMAFPPSLGFQAKQVAQREPGPFVSSFLTRHK